MNDKAPKKNNLAIVIPAYKRNFLFQALQSLTFQTNKNFCIYIGDDNSPHNLYNIVEGFEKFVPIVYHKFPTNIGSVSLTKQWERCIDLSKDEEWIWLFSDDDVASENCVEEFFSSLAMNDTFDIYKFETEIIDQDNKLIRSIPSKETTLSSKDFLVKKLSFQLDSFACEYIFKKSAYIENKGFKEFPLAWCSDDATWAMISKKKGIKIIQEAKVYWRYSGENLSSNLTKHYNTKEEAIMMFIKWINTEYILDKKQHKIQINYFLENAKHHLLPNSISVFFMLAKKLQSLFPDFSLYICARLINITLSNIYNNLKSGFKSRFR